VSTADPDHRTPRRNLWASRVLVVLVVVAQMLTCQSLLPATAGLATAMTTQQHGVEHDVVCEPGAAAVTPAVVRTAVNAPCTDPSPLPVETPETVADTGPGSAPPAPAWADQRLRPGRHLLLAIGITRV